jgi:hypothetical protein
VNSGDGSPARVRRVYGEAAALTGWRRREGRSAGAPGTPPASLMIGLVFAYLVAAVTVAWLPESVAMAFGPMVLVLVALGVDARSGDHRGLAPARVSSGSSRGSGPIVSLPWPLRRAAFAPLPR